MRIPHLRRARTPSGFCSAGHRWGSARDLETQDLAPRRSRARHARGQGPGSVGEHEQLINGVNADGVVELGSGSCLAELYLSNKVGQWPLQQPAAGGQQSVLPLFAPRPCGLAVCSPSPNLCLRSFSSHTRCDLVARVFSHRTCAPNWRVRRKSWANSGRATRTWCSRSS